MAKLLHLTTLVPFRIFEDVLEEERPVEAPVPATVPATVDHSSWIDQTTLEETSFTDAAAGRQHLSD